MAKIYSRASVKGSVSLPVEDAKKLEKLLFEISNEGRLSEQRKRKAQKYAECLAELLMAHASSRVSLPTQVFLAALQCLAYAVRHSIKKGFEKLMGDE